MSMNPIETKYRGCRFRSRLEARWAVFFDALGVKWEYEKEGYPLPSGHYLPDFWLPYGPFGDPEMAGAGFWVEIKPIAPTDREMQLMAELVKNTGHRGYIFSGMPDIGCGAMVFQHWRTKEPRKIPAVNGSLQLEPWTGNDCHFVAREASPKQGGWTCPFSPKIWDLKDFDAHRAINAARSARFEHGEQG